MLTWALIYGLTHKLVIPSGYLIVAIIADVIMVLGSFEIIFGR